MILDTSFIIDLMKNKSNALAKAQELEKSSSPVRSTAISVFELWQGLEDIQNPDKKEKIEHFLSSIGLLSFDLYSAKKAGTIYAELERKGELIEPEDCMIAGITIFHGETLLTRNKQHFERIKSLKIEGY